MRILLSVCSLVVTAVALPSQATLLVGPGGFAEIRQALAVAQPDDVVLVQPGTYAHFHVGVGVTIRAQVPGTVHVAYDSSYAAPGCTFLCLLTEGPTTFAVPAGQTAHVVGLDFAPTEYLGLFSAYHRVQVDGGQVHFENCSLQALRGAALLVGTSAHVHVNGCVLRGFNGQRSGADGVRVTDGNLTAVGCEMRGGAFPVQNVGAGLRVSGGTAHLSDCLLVGTGGFQALTGFGAAWLHGCDLQGSGCAVQWTSPQPEFDDCTFSSAIGCGIPTGPFPSLVGAEQLDPLLLGGLTTQRWHTDPNGLLLLVGSYGLGSTPLPGVLVEPAWLDQGSWFFVGVFAADAAGQLTTSFVVPNVPQLSDSEFWLGAASWPVFPLRTSPPVGGVIR